ncbi:hypothetical protein PV390_11690 [Streptomyces sp. ME02-6991-2A]|uniref:hypothetical protein n=1 Tax=Streptomyces TaxID=1883 RepID=UPI0029B0D176|nr:hypothetical protein [Streptomyces sp. ME02-6991-2A]MDX3375069.1 hypothetical protein [Streptomyces sp. ME02-6991-2A]
MSIGIDAYQHWKGKAVRRPVDVTTSTPLTWQAEKYGEAERRLTGRYLPPSAHSTGRAIAADALAELALGESIRRTVLRHRGGSVHAALELGATWAEVATALGGTPDEARAALRSYAGEQRQRHEDDRMAGQNPTGLSPEQYRSVLGLAELADHERTSLPSGQQPDEPLA